MVNLQKIKQHKFYKDFKPGPKIRQDIEKRKFPDNNGRPIIVIGIDQSVINTGFACLYYDPSSENYIKFISIFGDYKNNSDIVTNIIKVNHEHRSACMPEYFQAYDDYVNKLNIMKKILFMRLRDMGFIKCIDDQDYDIPEVFVIIESVFFGKVNVIKNLIRHQTVTGINMRFFPNEVDGVKTNIYEYSAAKAKQSLGNVGVKKDNVTEEINRIFGTNMPTYSDLKAGSAKQSEYELFSHISDATALAYAFIQDFILSQTTMSNLFEEN